jgi:hypothetical protein
LANVPTFVGQGSAYDTAEYVLQNARAAINDVMEDIGGDILTDTWPATFVYLNQAKRIVEHELASNGVEFNVKETTLLSIAPCQSSDPTTQVWISQSGYFDGVANHANPALPGDLIVPLRLWERFSNTQNPFFQITPASDGIEGFLMQVQQFRYWDWRTDAIYLPGASMTNDIRMRYVSYSPELTGPTSIVPFRRSAIAIAFMTAWCFSNPRGNAQAQTLYDMAKQEIDQIISSTTRKKQRKATAKRAYGGRGGQPNSAQF